MCSEVSPNPLSQATIPTGVFCAWWADGEPAPIFRGRDGARIPADKIYRIPADENGPGGLAMLDSNLRDEDTAPRRAS